MRKCLAICIQTKDGLSVISEQTAFYEAQVVANQLAQSTGNYPDRILLVEAPEDGAPPKVIEDWVCGDDYEIQV